MSPYISKLYLLIKFTTIFTTLILIKNVETRRHSPLLVEDDGAARRNNRPAVSECQFGKSLKELGSTWYADLGPPFGVMYCIKCECIAVPKKRRIVARVQCRNIKNECPPADCDDPVLLPGRCCKICPGDETETEIPQDYPVQVNADEEERNMKHFAALLTGRTSAFLKLEEMKSMYSINNPQNAIATARFTFHKKNLYYSFYLSSKIVRPRAIQFIDNIGNILEEHNLMTPLNGLLSSYQNSTGKICGVWRRIPRDYKRLLRDEKLFVILLWDRKFQSELALAGRIARYTALSTELFSSLLEPGIGTIPEQMNGSGGTAIVSTTSGAASSVHLTIVFNGIFGPDDTFDVPINIRIESPERKEIILDEIQKIKKPSPEINILEISSPISIQNLRLLGRGKLILTVESRKYLNLKIQGHIITRATCELFQTLLTPSNQNSNSIVRTNSGLAWVYLNTDGSLAYNIQTNELRESERPNITLTDDNGRKKGILEDLSANFNYNQAIGTVDKLGPRVLEALYSGDLGVNIALENNTQVIRGRLTSRYVADARDSSEPILLKHHKSLAHPSNTYYMGMAWIAIDNECNLHYEVTISGINNNQQIFQIYLEEKPIEAIGAPISRKLLEEFSGTHLEGFVLNMPYNELAKLESSVCYLEIYSKASKELLLRGKLKSTKVPSHCYPVFTDNNVPNVNVIPNDHNDNMLLSHETKCFHSGRFYDEAEQWRSTREICTMCTCQYGRVICDAIKCPNPKCKPNEHLVTREGECCPTCISTKFLQDTAIISNFNNSNKGCQLGNEIYLPGATWHPYLPPMGFDICTTCVCDPNTLQVQCPRIVCPQLDCPEKIAYRPDKKACCKICPESRSLNNVEKNSSNAENNNNQNYLRDEGSIRSFQKRNEEILANGGCKVINVFYENGQEWHPIIASHGEQKCVNCRCKDGKVTCGRKKCLRALCNNNNRGTGKRKGQKKDIMNNNEIDECCTAMQCRRERRHGGHRKLHRDREDKNTLEIEKTTTSRSTHTKRS
ncbi:dorsal-ventral patterning protein Sog [Condylostylus longicornis]|uniref:dorsal-ventral patterning protein Sog n=1 Tax=Condylostylus longicornis TaxID=2530218 RepID=UPI00244E1998|nr:dorsal-ventral patterning protein Sog [Condylostylus longicornis]XP_055384864.1 dorsal-ventral patterning protein Sog [Condylostylus longicornis]